jgi:hypothetical protein
MNDSLKELATEITKVAISVNPKTVDLKNGAVTGSAIIDLRRDILDALVKDAKEHPEYY